MPYALSRDRCYSKRRSFDLSKIIDFTQSAFVGTFVRFVVKLVAIGLDRNAQSVN